MSANLPPLLVPTPAFVASWPRGLRPASIRVTEQRACFLYVHPESGWAEVWLHPGGRSLCRDSMVFSDAALRRLEDALRARWQRDSPAADAWLASALRHRASVLAVAPTAPPRDGAIDTARRVLLARHHPLEALEGLKDFEPETGRELSCAELACRAFLLALAGRSPEARPLAVEAGERALGLERGPVAHLLATLTEVDAASACLAGGKRDGTIPMRSLAWVAGLAGNPEHARIAVEELLASNSGDERRAALDSLIVAGSLDDTLAWLKARAEAYPSSELFERIAELHLWRLETSEARTFAARAGDTPVAALVLGAVDVLAGQHQVALERLADLNGRPEVTARLWCIRALLELGRVHQAISLSQAGSYADRAAWKLWRTYADAHADPTTALRGKEAFQTRLLLETIHSKAVVDAAYARDELAMRLTRQTLERMGGNYSPLATWLTNGSLQISYLFAPRARAVNAQLAIVEHGMDAALADLEAQARAMPSSPFPRTYRAELLLWSGRTSEARDAFTEIWEQTRTRWGYVGLGAAELYLGNVSAALAAWEDGLNHYDYLPAEATRAYRGEAYLATDRLEEARAELEHATQASPTRVGAWAALALARLRASDAAGARAALDEIASRAPALLAMVADEHRVKPRSSDPGAMQLLASATLESLGGNRASELFTFRDHRGRQRALRSVPADHWPRLADQVAPLALDLLSVSLPFEDTAR